MLKALTVQAPYVHDVDRHIVRIPWRHRSGLERRQWVRISVTETGRSIVCQVYGDADDVTQPVIKMDRSLRDDLGVAEGTKYDFVIVPVGFLQKLCKGWLRHSDVGVQVSAFLGVIGALLGLVSVALGVIAFILSGGS